VNGEKGYIDLG